LSKGNGSSGRAAA
jgi:hypothetical protein